MEEKDIINMLQPNTVLTLNTDEHKWCNLFEDTVQMKLKDKRIEELTKELEEQKIITRELNSQIKLLTKIIKS